MRFDGRFEMLTPHNTFRVKCNHVQAICLEHHEKTCSSGLFLCVVFVRIQLFGYILFQIFRITRMTAIVA